MSATVQVKERPILFSGAMIRAILDGRKTQTRRVVKPQPAHRMVEPKVGLTIGMDPADDGALWYDADGIHPGREVRYPYGRPLGRLWVREAFSRCACDNCRATWPAKPAPDRIGCVHYPSYRATHNGPSGLVWRPSIHMPRWASRITLEITDVQVERVQEVSEEDAIAEGVSVLPLQSADDPSAWWQTGPGENHARTARIAFSKLWDSINGPRGYGWDANPWVWALTFRRVEDAA